jgi:hypothetical protein
VGRVFGDDHWNGVVVFGAETTEHIENLGRLMHGLTDVAQGIGELFETANVGRHVHVPLDQAPKLCLEIDGAMKLMIMELIMDGVLDGVGGGFRNMNDGTNIFGHTIVKPAEDTLINHDLVRIVAMESGWRGRKVGAKTKFADESIKETMPFYVVGFSEIKFYRGMRFDVYHLENGCRWRRDDRRSILNGGGGRGVGTRVGRGEVE